MKQGKFDEHFTVATDMTIQGAVTGGATIKPDATLVVQGAAGGPFLVEDGGILHVQGAFDLHRDSRVDGLLIVAGVLNGDPRHVLPGRVVLQAGTVINGWHGQCLLNPDGSRHELSRQVSDTINVSVQASDPLLYDPTEDAFTPLPV